MGRARSIPSELYPEIIKRWTLGQGPVEILQWLEKPDGTRPALSTSRQSVTRVIQEQLASHSEQSRLSVVNRARLNAPLAYDTIESAVSELHECIAATKKELPPEQLRRIVVRGQLLMKLTSICHRQLRAAGTMGSSADRLVERWEEVTNAMREEVVACESSTSDTKSDGRNPEPNPATTLVNESDVPAVPDTLVNPDPPPPGAPPEVRQAFEEGMCLAPCRLSTTSASVDEFQLTSASLPLTEPEQAFAAGYALGWAGELTQREERKPGDDENLLERTVEEMQFQKQRLRIRFLEEQCAQEIDDPPPTPIEEVVILTPELPVPEEYAADRRLREAWRFGREQLSPAFDLQDETSCEMPQEVVLTETELAWCAGREVCFPAQPAESTESANPDSPVMAAKTAMNASQEYLQFQKFLAYAERDARAEKMTRTHKTKGSQRPPLKRSSVEVWRPR